MEITLCLIVKNEAKKLPACLESFQGVFQKLMVIDTGSTDSTPEIARDFGAIVHHFDWVKDFSAARNFALSKADTKWVMMVDADDRIDADTKKALISALRNLPGETLGVCLPYHYSNAENGAGVAAYLPRIWRTDLGLKYTLPVHEYLDISENFLEKFVRVDCQILHEKSSEEFEESFSRNIEILENAYHEGDCHPRVLFYLGNDHYHAGNLEASLEWFNKFLGLKTKHPHEVHQALMMTAKIHLKNHDRDSAKKAYLDAIKASPEFLEPHVILGDLAMFEKEYSKAVEYYNNALRCSPPRTHIFLNTRLNRAYAENRLQQAVQALEQKQT